MKDKKMDSQYTPHRTMFITEIMNMSKVKDGTIYRTVVIKCGQTLGPSFRKGNMFGAKFENLKK